MLRLCYRCVFLCLILIGLGWFFANALLQRYIDNHLAEIEGRLSVALGAKVTVGELTAELRPFPQLEAQKVLIAWSDPLHPPLLVDNLQLRIKLAPLLSGNMLFDQIRVEIAEYIISSSNRIKLSDTSLQARLMVEGDQISMKGLEAASTVDGVAFTLTSPSAHFDHHELTIEQMVLRSGESQLAGSGHLNVDSHAFHFVTTDFILMPETAKQFLVLTGAAQALELGEVRGKLTGEGGSYNEFSAHGAVSVKKIRRGKSFSADLISLPSVQLNWQSSGVLKIKSEVKSDRLEILDGATRYASNHLNGVLDYQRDDKGASTLSGKLGLDQMRYADGRTTVKEVVGVIDPIHLNVKPSGDISLSLNIKSSALKLDHDSVQVTRSAAVYAPLTVTIPVKGSYRVSGPISVKDADIKTLKQELQHVEGTVQMNLTDSEKTFISKGLQFRNRGKNAHLAADFRMTPQKFSVISAESDFFDGSLALNGEMVRNGTAPFKVELKGQRLALQRIRDALIADTAGSAHGTADSVLVSLSGSTQTFPQSLVGGGTFSISQPDAEKTIFSRLLFGALRSVPVIGDILDARRGAVDRQILDAALHFKDSACHFDTARLTRANYTVNAKGKLDFNSMLTLKGEVVFLQETLVKLGFGIGPLKRLLSRAGRIVIPLTIRGAIPDVQVEADVKTFLKDNSGITFGEDLIRQVGGMILPDRQSSASSSSAPSR